jgi:transposase-like protein
MEFPITDLLEYDSSMAWLSQHLHPHGLRCPQCQQGVAQARVFRHTRKSQLPVYRCTACHRVYNLYTGTVLAQCHWLPQQVVLFLRGVCKGESTQELAAELGLNYKTVLTLRHKVQANAEAAQPETPLPDAQTETDEMFQNAGEKRRAAPRPRRPAALSGQPAAGAWHL